MYNYTKMSSQTQLLTYVFTITPRNCSKVISLLPTFNRLTSFALTKLIILFKSFFDKSYFFGGLNICGVCDMDIDEKSNVVIWSFDAINFIRFQCCGCVPSSIHNNVGRPLVLGLRVAISLTLTSSLGVL